MERTVHKIWQGIPPFTQSEDKELHEHLKENPRQDGIDRFTDVTSPELHFFPASGKAPHPAVLVCPGGGYGHLAWSHEGLDIASLMNLNGISAFILKYRCPKRRQQAHADAARAMRFIRSRAAEFAVIPDQVGAIGFSAGAHLAATISAPADAVPYPETDAIDTLPYKPDFTMLIYPAYLADENLKLAPEFHVDSTVPPTFLVQAEDDWVQPENSIGWYLALKRAGVPAEMHLYSAGGHGYGLLRTGNPVSAWGELASRWMQQVLNGKKENRTDLV